MRISTRLKKLEATRPKCDGPVLRFARGEDTPVAVERCRVCGGCHILVIEEVIVTAADLDAEREARSCE